jgi:hypothetical protein
MQKVKKDFYDKIKPKLIKEFDKNFSKHALKQITQDYGKLRAAQTVEAIRNEYDTLIPQLPYIGGKKNRSTTFLVGGALFLATIRILERDGLSVQEIGKYMYDIMTQVTRSKPRILKWIIRKMWFSKLYLWNLKKEANKFEPIIYPAGFVREVVEGDGKDFDFGWDTKECGIHKFFKQFGAEKNLPYVCLCDYAMFRELGIGMYRTQSIGCNGILCDFRFKKNLETRVGWPPETLEELKTLL